MTDTALPEQPAAGASRNPVRRLYDWTLAWAHRPSGPAALGVLAFAESSFFPIPPDPLLIALALGRPARALRFAGICTVGSVLGGLLGYWLGNVAWDAVSGFFFARIPGVTPQSFEAVRALYNKYDFWAVFIAGFTPIPYKVFTLASGVFAISLPVFIVASVVSRGARFFLLAGLVYWKGPRIKGFIDRHFNTLAWVFTALLIAGFVALKYVRIG